MTDHIAPAQLGKEEAKAKGNFVYDKPTIHNSVMLLWIIKLV